MYYRRDVRVYTNVEYHYRREFTRLRRNEETGVIPREGGCALPIERGVLKGPGDGVQMPARGRLLTRSLLAPRLPLVVPCATCSLGRHGRS